MKVNEFFENKRRDSAVIRRALDEHMAKLPEVDAEYSRIDKQCIALSCELVPAREAFSPTAVAIEAELRLKRYDRDAVKQRHSNRRRELERQLELYTAEPIRDFIEQSLALARDLIRRFRFEKLKPSHNILGRRLRNGVVIRHNAARLGEARDRIFQAIAEVRKLQHSDLETVETRISELRREFDGFDLYTMEVQEVSEDHGKELERLVQPERGEPAKGHLGPGGTVYVHPTHDEPRVAELAARISKLEKTT